MLAGRGMVVYPTPGREHEERRCWIGGFLPFLATVAVGAVILAIVAVLIGH